MGEQKPGEAKEGPSGDNRGRFSDANIGDSLWEAILPDRRTDALCIVPAWSFGWPGSKNV